MRVLFVQTNMNRMLIPLPIGAAMVAERLRRDGHEVLFVDLMGERHPERAVRTAVRAFAPELACFSIRNRDNQVLRGYDDPLPGIRRVIDAARGEARVPALLGGTAFTTFPSRMLRYMDAEYGIAGDDLEPIAGFVRSLESRTPDLATPGLVYRTDGGTVEANPFTLVGYRHATRGHHALIDRRRYRKAYWNAAVITRSGCPERCAYCDTAASFGREFVLREPRDIAEELLDLKRSGRARSAWLADAGFNRPLDHAKETLREIIRTGAQLRLYCVFDPGPADREFFRLFRRAGGCSVAMFAESLSDPVLAQLDKPFTAADVLRDAATMREEDVGFMFMPTFGSPGETPDTVEETLRLAPSLRATYSTFSIGWRIQPGAPLRQRAVAEGVVSAGDDCWDAHFYVSPKTPRPWLERRIRRFLIRHPLLNARAFPFMATQAFTRPWTWSAQPPDAAIS